MCSRKRVNFTRLKRRIIRMLVTSGSQRSWAHSHPNHIRLAV
jgi:hypothetical protein